jgi:hypothetical protein
MHVCKCTPATLTALQPQSASSERATNSDIPIVLLLVRLANPQQLESAHATAARKVPTAQKAVEAVNAWLAPDVSMTLAEQPTANECSVYQQLLNAAASNLQMI